MSKASEWADHFKIAKSAVSETEDRVWGEHERSKPMFSVSGRGGTTIVLSQAVIDDDGTLWVSIGGTRVSPEKALSYAHWILKTFGETPSPPTQEET